MPVIRHMYWPVLMVFGALIAATQCAAKAAFPLSVPPGGRHLVDAVGAPFHIHGDTAWSLIAQLRREDVDHYLTDRRARGFNTILVSLVERKFASDAPRNAYGELPFANHTPFQSPNEAYFSHADWVLKRAGEEGFLVLLTPSYAGFNGGDEGWYRDMESAGAETLEAYGEYLGRRYRDYDNILWVHAGDYDPPDKSLIRSVVEGISAYHPQALHTAHGSPESSSLDYWGAESWLDVNAVYTYGPVHEEVLAQRALDEHIPSFLIESIYENEHGANGRQLRMQAYQALLTGAVGQVFGNNPIWHFDGPGIYSAEVDWKEALDSEGARSMAHLATLIGTFAWWKLVPDVQNELLVEGAGPRESRAVGAAAEDGSFALLYLPSRREAVVDLGTMTGDSVTARWYDPAAGRFAAVVGSPLPAGGHHRFGAELGRNAAGADDWLLFLEAQP